MAKADTYRRLPNGFPTLLNKMLRAVLISRPLETVEFLTDYLEAEVNRRTLCDLQLRQPCPSGSVQPIDPWVQYMSFVTIQKAIDALVQEEHPTRTTSFRWDDDHRRRRSLLRGQTPKCGVTSARHRITHKPFKWPPVVKATPRCRRRFDRYGPIVETISITSRSIKRYVTDEGAKGVADQCQGRRPIPNYWRQILRDCSVKADQWNRKTEQPRRRLRSSSLTTDKTSFGGAEGEETDSGEGSGSSIDPYLEPKRRRKSRNDEGLAKIIYRELGIRLPPIPPIPPPSEVEEKLPPGKANQAVQVELVPSRLPGHRPPPTTDEEIPVELLDKAVQVDMDETLAEDTWAVYPAPDGPSPELEAPLTCPPSPMPVPLAVDWTLFLRPTEPWPDAPFNWLTTYEDEEEEEEEDEEEEEEEEEEEDGADLRALQAEPSLAAEARAEDSRFLQDGDLDFPATKTVADAPALPLLLAETDATAGSDLADVPAEPFDHVADDVPSATAAADAPAEAMMPAKESAAQMMNEDEMDDPFSDAGPPVPLVASEGQGSEPLLTSEDQGPEPLVTLEGQGSEPLVTSEDQGPESLVTLEGQEPVLLVASEGHGSSTLLPEAPEVKA